MRPTKDARGVDYQPTRLEIDPDLPFAKAREVAAAVGQMSKGHQWWAGDLLVHCEDNYPEDEWPQIEADLNLEPKTALNWRYVARYVTPSRRREALTFSHHAEVARLDADDQARLLEQAEREGWTVRQLRDAVALEFPTGQPPLFDDPPPEEDKLRELLLLAGAVVKAFNAWQAATGHAGKRAARDQLAQTIDGLEARL